ncbi:hypothetical protein OQA88_2268 [Cercophora sp. LCS_1]
MDPLSVTASVAGILAAAAKVTSLIGQVKDAPESVSAILTEVTHIQIVVGALQSFVNRSRRLDAERAALIQVENVVTVLTQTVLVFSELGTLVTSVSALASQGRLSRLRSRATRTWHHSAALRLVGQLQQHKTSLSLLLQIMQCESVTEAHEGALSLQEHIEQQLERDSDLASRLQHLELSPDDIELRGLTLSEPSANRDLNSEEGQSNRPPIPLDPPRGDRATPEKGNGTRQGFDEILSESRLYTRVQHLEIDAASTILTTRSRAWSVLSGISLAQISTIAVIKLPLQEPELRRFWNLASPSAMSSATSVAEQAATPTYLYKHVVPDPDFPHLSDEEWLGAYGLTPQIFKDQGGGSSKRLLPKFIGKDSGGGATKRIIRELAEIGRDPPSSVSAGPTTTEHGDNVVSNTVLANTLRWGQ